MLLLPAYQLDVSIYINVAFYHFSIKKTDDLKSHPFQKSIFYKVGIWHTKYLLNLLFQ